MKGKAVTVGALLALALAGCGEPDVQTLMAEARQDYEAGHYKDAVVALKNVLKQQPDNAEARYVLGVTALAGGDAAGAEAQLRRAAELGISPERTQPKLARALFIQDEYEAVLQLGDGQALDAPRARLEFLVVRGRAATRLGDLQAARSALDRAARIDDSYPPLLIATARLAMAQGELGRAAEIVDQAGEQGEERAEVQLLRADLAMRRQRYGTAAERYAALMEENLAAIAHSERIRARGTMIEALVRDGQLERARSAADSFVDGARRNPVANLFAGYVAYHQGDLEVAADRLQVVLSRMPDHPTALSLMGAVKARQGQLAQAQMYLNEAVAASPGDVQSRVLLASVAERMGRSDEASRIISEGVARAGTDPDALRRLGGMALQGGYLTDVVGSLRGEAGSRQALQLQAVLAQSLLATGRADDAIDVLSESVSDHGEGELARRTLLVLATAKSGELDRALEQARALRQQFPDNPRVMHLLAAVYMAREEYGKSEKILREMLSAGADKAAVYRTLGLLNLAWQRPREAREAFQTALEQAPLSAGAMFGMARAEHALGNEDEAVGWLRRVREVSDQAWHARVVLGFYELNRGNAELARELAREARAANGRAAPVHALLGLSSLALDDPQTAVDSLGKAVDARPGSARLRFLLGRAQLAATDINAARETAETLRDDYRAQAYADMLDGLMFRASGEHERAAKSFSLAARAGMREAVGLAMNARAQAGLENPVEPLQSWLEEHPQDQGVRLALAQWLTQEGRNTAAIAEYETLLEQGMDQSPHVLNNLAWLYHQTGDERAAALADRALEVAPDSPAVMDTAGWILLDSDRSATAVDLLARAVQAAPQQPEIRYHYAVALERQGQGEAALEQLRQALADDSQFPGRSDAEQLLQRLAQ